MHQVANKTVLHFHENKHRTELKSYLSKARYILLFRKWGTRPRAGCAAAQSNGRVVKIPHPELATICT